MKNKMPFFITFRELYYERFYINHSRLIPIANDIKRYLFESIYETGRTQFALNFENASAAQRIEFLEEMTECLHWKCINQKYPNTDYYFSYATHIDEHETDFERKATYFPDTREIEYYGQTAPENLSVGMSYIGHEYTHVMQSAGYSTIGTALLKFIDKYNRIYNFIISYDKRIEEKESRFIEKMVRQNFVRDFKKFLRAKNPNQR